ncbi:MAG: polyamine ABC transporter substrate-binding protein [Pseudoxanthomonas sp.]
MKLTRNKLSILAVMVASTLLAGCGAKKDAGTDAAPAAAEGSKVVNVYNWSDYIAEETNPDFEKATGIKVVYDVFDTDEVLETKLLAGNSGYDVVVPSSSFLGREVQAGVFLPLDKSKIPNYAGIDPVILKRLEGKDPGNTYAIPYMWGTVGIGYNTAKVAKALGSEDAAKSLDIVFKPENMAKLKSCGVSFLDSPIDVIPLALNYLKEDPNSRDPAVIQKVVPLLKAVRPYITNFDSAAYIDTLANGDVCVAVGYSGDVIQARDRASEAENGVEVAYAIPKEGTSIWVDSLTIPKDAKHADAAYAYINNLLDPKVEAANTNYIGYPNPVPASKEFVDPEIVADTSVYPPAEQVATFFDQGVLPQETAALYNRIWTELKTGK